MEAAKILVVEDEHLVAKDIENMLKNMGYEVISMVPSGEQAVLKAKEKSPDLVLMDIVLKGEMDGIVAAQKIKETSAVPVVYLTAHADERTLMRAKATDPVGYLLKPFDQRELQTTIELALDKHKKEKKIQEREEWFSKILKIMKEAVVSTDKNGTVIFMNPHAEALTGWKQGEALGKPLQDIFKIMNQKTGEEVVFPEKAKQQKSIWESPNHSLLMAKDGKAVSVEVTAALIKDKKGNLLDTVFVFHGTSEMQAKDQDLAHLIMPDQVTGLPSQLIFCDRLAMGMALARRHQQKIAVMMISLDRLKLTKSSMAADKESKLLKAMAKRFAQVLRKSDTIARLESGEFILLLLDITQAEAVASVAQRLCSSFQKPLYFSGLKILVNLHIGVAVFPDDGEDYEILLKNTKAAMLRAKETGKPICFYSQGDAE